MGCLTRKDGDGDGKKTPLKGKLIFHQQTGHCLPKDERTSFKLPKATLPQNTKLGKKTTLKK